jgi:DNA-binding transcriptional LysR family regulator
MTNFHQLQIFHAVAIHGSFSKAARALSISQPAVSIQVRGLEEAIGSPLLHRTRRGPMLTDIGAAVFSYTRRIFALADEMDEAVREVQGLRSGRLTIGSSTTPGEYILPFVIGEFQKQYPDIEVSLSISNTEAILEKIRYREIDLGMAGAPVTIEGLASFTYVDDEIVIIGSPDHPLMDRPGLSMGDLEGERFITREEGSATRKTAEQCLAANGVAVKVVMELGSNEAVKRAAAAGLGLGMVSSFGAAQDVAGGYVKILPVSGWDCRRPLSVFHREGEHLPAAQRAFLEFLRVERPMPPGA